MALLGGPGLPRLLSGEICLGRVVSGQAPGTPAGIAARLPCTVLTVPLATVFNPCVINFHIGPICKAHARWLGRQS